MKKYQRGFIDIPKGVFETLFVLAAVGLVATVTGLGYGLYWLATHVRFV